MKKEIVFFIGAGFTKAVVNTAPKGAEFFDYAFDREDFADALKEPSCTGYILYSDSNPIAYILGTNNDEEIPIEKYGEMFYLRSWALIPEIRGKGLARQLMELFVSSVEDRGYRALMLNAPHTPGNKQLYESLGFKLVRIEKDYYLINATRKPSVVYDAAVFVRELA